MSALGTQAAPSRYRAPSLEIAVEKLVQTVTCIVRSRAIVFQVVTKDRPAGLQLRIVESMVRGGIDDEFDRWAVLTPVCKFDGAVFCRCPIVDCPDENERG